MSILLRNRITGITTSTDLFGEDLALFLREYPDLVKVGIGTTANQPYYILLNETIEEFRSPYANNGLSYNPSTGTLSAGVFSGNGSGLSNVTATGSGIEIKDDNVPVGTARTVNFANNLSVTFASGIATVSGASSVSFATNAGIATYATSAGIATYASNAGIATYATSAGIATYATSSGIATYATSSGIATNVTTNANLTGHVTSVGNAAVLGSFTSAQLATALTDETGSGSAVFATSPTLTTPALGTPASGTLSSCTVDGTYLVGYKKIPPAGTKTSSYTLIAGDVGKFVELGSGGTVVVPASVFSAGDAIIIFNNTASSITCTCSDVTTVYKGGTDADISTFSVTTRGVANILFISATVAVVTGNLS